jgi:hypothetical protein
MECLLTLTRYGWLVGFMVLNTNFNNIAGISWRSVLLVKTTDLSQVIDKLCHIMLYSTRCEMCINIKLLHSPNCCICCSVILIGADYQHTCVHFILSRVYECRLPAHMCSLHTLSCVWVPTTSTHVFTSYSLVCMSADYQHTCVHFILSRVYELLL